MKIRFVFQTLIATLAFAIATNARAENHRVLLIHSGAGDPVSAHLVDELVAMGCTVEIVPPGEYDLANLARARRARAVVKVAPSRRAIDLWTEGKGAVVHIEETTAEKGDLATLSLRAVEELRGQLLSANLPPEDHSLDKPPALPANDSRPIPPSAIGSKPLGAPVRPSEPRGTPIRAEAPKPGGHVYLNLAPAAIVHPGSGGMTAGGNVVGGLRWMPTKRFGADFVGFVPFIPSNITSSAGNVRISASAVLAGVWMELVRPVPVLAIGAGAGVGGGIINHYGQPQMSGIEARDGTVAYALPYARSAITWTLTPNIALRVDVLGAIASPRPVLRLPGRTTDVYFGQPMLMFGLGVDLKLR